MRIRTLLFVLCFFLLVLLPLTGMVWNIAPEFDEREGREQAAAPTLPDSFYDLKPYFAEWDKYISDHFGFRDWLIYWHGYIQYYVFNSFNVGRVIDGKDGWLFQALSEKDRCGMLLLSQDAEDSLVERVARNQAFAKEHDILYLVVIVPSKIKVYTEFLRKENQCTLGPENKYIQVFEALQGRVPDLAVLDLREPLIQAKPTGDLYYKSDLHWNDRGAFAGYKAMVETLAHYLENIPPVEEDAYQFQLKTHESGSLARTANIPTLESSGYFLERTRPTRAIRTDAKKDEELGQWSYNREITTYTIDNTELKNALIFHNSFFKQIKPLLAEHFHHTTYVWDGFDIAKQRAMIDEYQPDVIIEQLYY